MYFQGVLSLLAVSAAIVHGSIINRNPGKACPKSYVSVGSMCVRSYSIAATYAEAYKLCTVVGALLASPANDAEYDGLASMLQTLPYNSDHFLRKTGMDDICPFLSRSSDYSLMSGKCGQIKYFVCQKEL